MDTLQQAWHGLLDTPWLAQLLVLVWAIYLVVLGAWIVLQKREPVATLSWLLGLAFLPYVGFLIYHFFGPQKIRRHRLRRRARSNDQGVDAGSSGPDVAEMARMIEKTTGMPFTTASDVRLLSDGAGKFGALLEAIGQAREHVHLEYYIWLPDRCGTALCEALTERARAGVKVRLLLDAVGAGKARRAFSALVEAGGEVAWFHPTRFGQVWRRPWTNLRTHRKIVIIDGRIGFTGGMNITDEQDERVCKEAYRDLHLRIEGAAVRSLQRVFAEDWAYATGSQAFLPEVAAQTPAATTGHIRTQVITSGPDSGWESIHRAYVSAIHAARHRVWMTTPYFVPGEAAMMALTSAALAGLDVRLVVPRDSDSRLVTLAARSYFGTLLRAGVKIHEHGPRMLHAKTLLIDDGPAFVGSANFDHRSFRLNFEVSVLIDDDAISQQLQTLMLEYMRDAPEVQRDRARPLLRARLPEALARLASPLL